jgi:thiol-disulfide isomerase/thioredoxin
VTTNANKSENRGPDRYRIERPTISVLLSDMRIPKGDLGPGDRVPDFDLPTTDWGRFSNKSIAADGRPVLLVFGSLTCPITESAGEGLQDLHARYGEDIRFVVVNVREAHPGAAVGQPRIIEQKFHNANALKVHHGFGFEVAVDDIDGTLHRAFGPRPSSAYIIDPTGTIVFRSHWSNLTDALDQALAAVAAKKTPPRSKVGQTLRSMAKMTGHAEVAFGSAGQGALLDTWKVAPPFAAMIVLSRIYGFLPRSQRGLPTIVTMMVLGIALVAGTIIIIR